MEKARCRIVHIRCYFLRMGPGSEEHSDQSWCPRASSPRGRMPRGEGEFGEHQVVPFHSTEVLRERQVCKGEAGKLKFQRDPWTRQAEELELYHRQWSLLKVLSRQCFSINVYFMRVKKKCYLLCKNAPGRILTKLIALIASGKGIQ